MRPCGAGNCRTVAASSAAFSLILLGGLGYAQPSRHFRFRFAEDFQEITLDGRKRAQMAQAGQPSTSEPYLGLELRDGKTGRGCLVRGVRPGPLREAGSIRDGDFILSLNGKETDTAEQFRQVFSALRPGAEVRLTVRRTGEAAPVAVAARVASRAEWAPPIDWIRPPRERIVPDQVVPVSAGSTRLEQFLEPHLARTGIREPADKLRKYLVETMESVYGPNMLSRVAYGFYRPTRLAELQVSMTSPLAEIGDRAKQDPFPVLPGVLEQAARNLDVPFSRARGESIEVANPRQALLAVSRRVNQAHTRLERAFGKLDASRRAELDSSLLELLADEAQGKDTKWVNGPSIRAGQASLSLDYTQLFQAAEALAGWTPSGPPAGVDQPRAVLPKELAGAVRGDVLAAERIAGRWYVYGGPGANEYDLSIVDVVLDAGGDDIYRYPANQRPKLQLVFDMDGNDRYSGENGAPGPASAMLGVSVVIDRRGNDVYEGGLRSCGAGIMGIGLIIDHAGTDTYRGTKWSLGAGYYGFGGIVDLEGSDVYQAEQYSEAIGGPRGFGLILDVSGNDLYRANGPRPSVYGDPGVFAAYSQGIGIGAWWPWTTGFDTGGIGLICDLDGDDRYEVGEMGQGMGFYFGLGMLYDRGGRDLYYGTRYGQATSAHGGVGILADDGGDDTYWGSIAEAWDLSLALLIDRGGDDSYQSARSGGAIGAGEQQSIAWLIDLDGRDRYNQGTRTPVAVVASSPLWTHDRAAYATAGMGESSANEYNYKFCQCYSLSVFLDTSGSPDSYSRSDREDGLTIATGKVNQWKPEYSNLNGLFIDTAERELAGWLPAKQPSVAVPVVLDAQTLAAYAGLYDMNVGGVVTISVEGRDLKATIAGLGEFELQAVGKDRFSVKTTEFHVEFFRNQLGQVESLVFGREGLDRRGVRRR